MPTLAFLGLQAANTSIMCNSDHVFWLIMRLARPKIVDASLMLISKIGQRRCHYSFSV